MSDAPSSRSSADSDDWTISDEPPATDEAAGWIDDIVPDVSAFQPAPDRPRAQRQVDPNSPIVMVETAFLASASSLIWFINSYFPIGPILQVFFPIPIALIYLRWGRRPAWMTALIATLLLTILVGPTRSILFLIPYGFLGVLLGVMWYRRASWGMSIFLGTLLLTVGSFFRLWLLSILLGQDMWQYSTVQVTGFLDWGFDRLNILQQPNLALVQAIAAALIVLRNLVYLFVVHVVSWFLCDRLGNPIPRPPRWVRVLFELE
ncbi:DUF2232 domain-containing protein [filamentous cyanobacterium LEGE 11480]|uniref:DUF2232 domain-containing protein n=1 Tax=Romeriopsis navalis LEGE 11480 TaxID=2777977 RepID=A0A928VL13_9CYAN|nr:DUF2232 domain-containing protein [Romeriopsis navalis]MBE9028480.1 DUF2232 domain-containing protein [Romeriopsis navalis LEGE 11480]